MQSQPQYPYQPMGQAQFQLPYVGVGRRFVALLIDAVILAVVNGILVGILQAASRGSGSTLAGVLAAIIAFGYFIYMEGNSGATFGKRVVGIRVVKEDGSPISMGDAVVRNLLRIVDGLFAYLVGAILIWTSDKKQRLGDRVAKTIVISS